MPEFNCSRRRIALFRQGALQLVCCVIAIELVLFAAHAGEPPTSVFYNGTIITMDESKPAAEAVAVRDGRIIAVGKKENVITAAGDDAEFVDLEQNTLLPGFIDAHGHFSLSLIQSVMENVASPPVGAVGSIADIQAILTKAREKSSKGDWIMAAGYDDALLKEKRHPNKFDLDAVSTEHPIMLWHVSQHLMVCNSKCLQIAGITADTVDPEGGVIQRVEGSQQPNGVLEEHALYKMVPVLPINDLDTRLKLIEKTQNLYASYGITTVQDGSSLAADLTMLEIAGKNDQLKLDIVAYPNYQLHKLVKEKYPPTKVYRNGWRVGGVKLILDGSPQGKTAFLSHPYHVPPAGQTADYVGYPAMPDQEVIAYVGKFFAEGWPILVHTNGDASSDQMIMAVKEAVAEGNNNDHRAVMIHAQTVREDQLDDIAALGVIPSFFVSHTYFWGDWHTASVFGPERASRISPTRSALDRDIRFTIHNDSPVVPPDIMHLIWIAVNRSTRSGKTLGEAQQIPVYEALKAVTINAAYQHFEETSKGSIETGKLADFAVLSKNPLKVPADEIKDIMVLQTYKNGKMIFSRTDLP